MILEDVKIPSSVSVNKAFSAKNPKVIGYKRQIGQVLRVIFFNSVESMNGEGVLTIRTSELVSGYDEFFVIDVRDTGKGVPEENISNIFRIKKSRRSKTKFGMGLAWARLFLDMIGGQIKVTSHKEKEFELRIIVPKDVRKTKDEFLLNNWGNGEYDNMTEKISNKPIFYHFEDEEDWRQIIEEIIKKTTDLKYVRVNVPIAKLKEYFLLVGRHQKK